MLTYNDFLNNNNNPISEFYSEFKVTERILLTGHSHQAWPDVAFDGLKEYWVDSSKLIDDKWERVFHKADLVRKFFAKLMDCDHHLITLNQSTHDLLIKFLSAIDFTKRKKVITTNGEFHSVRRQLDKLHEMGIIDLVKVDIHDYKTISERVANLIDDDTALVVISKVFFINSVKVDHLNIIHDTCDKFGVKLLIDLYHTLNAIPFSIFEEKLENAYFIGGGYKYCQLGEGNCFLKIPENCDLYPIFTGWFSEFTALAEKSSGKVDYGVNHWKFAGATFDPISHYRASKVIQFFDENNLTAEFLNKINKMQNGILVEEFDKFDFNSNIIRRYHEVPLNDIGGFLVFHTPYANEISNSLKNYDVWSDYRGNNLRLGPAPYIANNQLVNAIDALYKVTQEI